MFIPVQYICMHENVFKYATPLDLVHQNWAQFVNMHIILKHYIYSTCLPFHLILTMGRVPPSGSLNYPGESPRALDRDIQSIKLCFILYILPSKLGFYMSWEGRRSETAIS